MSAKSTQGVHGHVWIKLLPTFILISIVLGSWLLDRARLSRWLLGCQKRTGAIADTSGWETWATVQRAFAIFVLAMGFIAGIAFAYFKASPPKHSSGKSHSRSLTRNVVQGFVVVTTWGLVLSIIECGLWVMDSAILKNDIEVCEKHPSAHGGYWTTAKGDMWIGVALITLGFIVMCIDVISHGRLVQRMQQYGLQ